MIFLLIQTLTANQQISFMRNKDLGLNLKKTVVVRTPQTNQQQLNYQTFKKALLNYPDIKSVGLSSAVPGMPAHQMSTTTGINPVIALNEHNYYISSIDSDFIPTMEMEIATGNNFIANSTNMDQIIVNEEAIRLWGYASPEEAIEKKIAFWGMKSNIIGVMKNFHQTTVKSAHIPMIFMFEDQLDELASIKLKPGGLKNQLTQILHTYESIFPNSPFESLRDINSPTLSRSLNYCP